MLVMFTIILSTMTRIGVINWLASSSAIHVCVCQNISYEHYIQFAPFSFFVFQSSTFFSFFFLQRDIANLWLISFQFFSFSNGILSCNFRVALGQREPEYQGKVRSFYLSGKVRVWKKTLHKSGNFYKRHFLNNCWG